MSDRILKFPIEIVDRQVIVVPGSKWKPLDVQAQYGQLCLWALTDDEGGTTDVMVDVVGTGNPVPFYTGDFLATAQLDRFVWHIFTKLAPSDWRSDATIWRA